MTPKYIFKSERLGFRTWMEVDKPELVAINNDPLVMEFFPSMPDAKQHPMESEIWCPGIRFT